jgi:DDE_Tnp_1-associated
MSSSLTEIVLPQRPPHLPCPTTVTDGDRLSLFVALAAVEDPRDPRGRRYPLVAILAAAVCAVIAGACTFAAVTDGMRFQDRTVWARLGFEGRVPAATMVWRLLIRIDAEVLSQVLARWLRSRATPGPAAGHWWRRVIAVDGKAARGARLPDGRQAHPLGDGIMQTGLLGQAHHRNAFSSARRSRPGQAAEPAEADDLLLPIVQVFDRRPEDDPPGHRRGGREWTGHARAPAVTVSGHGCAASY